jgi:hypothetical protein
MQINGKVIAGIAAGVGIVAGAGLLLSACGNRSGGAPQDGPMSDLTKDLMSHLKPGNNARLSVTADAVRRVTADDGHATGAFDGARLLQAADAHAYGTPTIGNPTVDVQNDGFATFNEIRHVVRHYDVDQSGAFSHEEAQAFEAADGIRWIPA